MDSKPHGRQGKRPVFWVPESFHPENILAPKLRRHHESALYVMHSIITRVAFGSRKCARLRMAYLRNVLGRHACWPIMTALLDSGDIRRIGGYTVGRHAYGYLPAQRYEVEWAFQRQLASMGFSLQLKAA